jgi:hypothetical protein
MHREVPLLNKLTYCSGPPVRVWSRTLLTPGSMSGQGIFLTWRLRKLSHENN